MTAMRNGASHKMFEDSEFSYDGGKSFQMDAPFKCKGDNF